MRMMRRKGVWTNNLATLLTGTCMYGSLTFVAEFVQTPPSAGYGFGASVTAAGLIIAPQPALVIAVGPIIGRLTARIGSQLVLVVGAVFCTASMLMAALAHNQAWELAVSMGLIGVGIGLLVAAQANVAVTTVPPEQTGVAAGMNANIRLIGGSIGAAVMGAVVTSVLQPSGLPAVAGYTSAFGLVAVLSLAGAAVALLIPAGRTMAVMLPEEEVVPP
jgi:MFS family permease